MIDLSFLDISNRLRKFNFPPTDRVVGIAQGGIVPASLIAHQLQCPLHIITINYRDQHNIPLYEAPALIKGLEAAIPAGSRLLLVDDVSVTGKTLELARTLLGENPINTFTLKGRADHVLFPEVSDCVNWPWKSNFKLSSHERTT